jgi:hypothetical protein
MTAYDSGYDSGYGPSPMPPGADDGMVEFATAILVRLQLVLDLNTSAVTAGEPAASDDCEAVYVWATQIFDSPEGVVARGDEAGCFFRRAYEFFYRIDICVDIHDDGSELTPTESLGLAVELYDLADAAWCTLAHGASDGTLFDIKCEDIVLGPLVIGDVQGDRVSATGSLRVTWPCSPEGS